MSFISLEEIAIIVVISLMILGPQKTFSAAFYIGSLFKKAKTYATQIQKELSLNESSASVVGAVNDFKKALSDPLVSKVPEKSSKRMWTVTQDSFKEQSNKDNAKALSDEKILERIEALEKQLSELKAQITKE